MKWAFRQDIRNAGAKFVLVALGNFADEHGTCYPGQERLAAMTGQSVASVGRHIKWLEANRYLSRRRRADGNGYRTSDRFVLELHRPTDQSANKADRQVGNLPSSQSVAPTHQIEAHLPVNLPEEPSVDPSGEPSDLAQARRKRKTDRFDEFWQLYPRKKDKGKARPAWEKALKKADADTILAGLRRYVDDPRTHRDGGQYIKYPASWLNAEAWDDDYSPPRPSTGRRDVGVDQWLA